MSYPTTVLKLLEVVLAGKFQFLTRLGALLFWIEARYFTSASVMAPLCRALTMCIKSMCSLVPALIDTGD